MRPRGVALLLASALARQGVEAGPPPLVAAGAHEILEAVRRPGAEVTVVNVWATWCLPCREEFPDLMRLNDRFGPRGLRLILVAADFADDRERAVGEFLAGHDVDFTSYLKTGDDMQFIDTIEPRWSGALPATFVYDAGGTLRYFQEGRASYRTLKRQVRSILEGKNPDP
jgi:thiol-disulfide isomerase/thioredoxin